MNAQFYKAIASSLTLTFPSPAQSQKANEKSKARTETKDQVWIPTGDGGDNSGLYLCEAQRHPAELAHGGTLFPFQRTLSLLMCRIVNDSCRAASLATQVPGKPWAVWMRFGHLHGIYPLTVFSLVHFFHEVTTKNDNKMKSKT